MSEDAKKRTEYHREYRRKNAEKRRESDRLYRQNNPEKKKADNARYKAEHQEELREYAKNRPITEKGKETKREYRQANKDSINAYQRDRRAKIRLEAIELLGGKCVKCGFSDWRAMQIDHVNGKGNQERKGVRSLYGYYKNILQSIKSGHLEYQLLCANCNQIKRYVQNENPKQDKPGV